MFYSYNAPNSISAGDSAPYLAGGGAYRAPPDLLAGFKGPTSKGRGRKGWEDK